MSRYECPRCKATCFTTDAPHLCGDLRKRLERQEQAVALVADILCQHDFRSRGTAEITALEIVKALSGRDLGT